MDSTDLPTLTLFDDHPPHQLHMLAGWWAASCAVCGYTVASDKRQDRCERQARRTPCPVCNPQAAA
jgi:hypothetical protein